MIASLDALLQLVETNDLPLSISLDPTQWWQGRPDLFNFWDPSAAGYNPSNVYNVEWTGPSPDNATAISWRNWGSQFRMPCPHPNLASPFFRAAAAESVKPLAARIARWHAALPAGKSYLLAYVRAVQELWIGTNYYYYPNGNALLPKPPKDDPVSGLAGSLQLGFAAVCGDHAGSAGCAASPPRLGVADLDGVVSSFLTFAAGVLLDAGIPRSRVMVHTGSFWGAPPPCADAPCAFNSAQAALTGAAAPGWSLYTSATDAARDAGLLAALDAIDGAPWGAPEWLASFSRGQPQALWAAALQGTMAVRNNRLVVVQNYESVRGDPGPLAAIAAALAQPPACLVDAATGLRSVRVNSSAWTLVWAQASTTVDAVALSVSTLAATLPSGALALPNVAQTTLGGAVTSYLFVLPAQFAGANVWWAVVTRGCAGQSVAADAAVICTSCL